MKKENPINEDIEIQIAERISLNENNFKFKKYYLFIAFFLLFLLPFSGLAIISNLNINFSGVNNLKKIVNNDSSILGHLPYKEISKEKLVFIEPNIEVHIDMSKHLLEMRDDAKIDGINLVFLSGYRSISLQKDIFYSLKSMRNQIAAERAKVSAPPGYSEHSTGFACEIGDAY